MSLWSRRDRPPAITAATYPASPSIPTGRSTPASGSIGSRPAGTDPVPGHAAQQWQWDIWAFYDTTGPLKFAGIYRGNMYRRLRLGIGVRPEHDPDGVPIPLDDILDPDKKQVVAPPNVPLDLLMAAKVSLARIRGRLGQSQILYDLGVNLTMAADCRLAAIPDSTSVGGERWQVYSIVELRQSGTWPDGTPRWTELGPPSQVLPQGTMVWRIYNPHPARHALADSSAMGAINDLEELALLGRQFRSLAKSRVAGAGVFTLPSELGLGKPADPTKPDGPSKITADLARHMSSSLKNEDAASNLVPHIIEGPADLLKPEYIRHIAFERPADALMNDREKAKLESLAISLDTPPEIILGIGDANHWNAAQVSEDNWKAHGEPGALLMCAGLTFGPLLALITAQSMQNDDGTPYLDAFGMPARRWTPEQIAQVLIIADPSQVIGHPDRGKDAEFLHSAYVISDAALREAKNFTDSDAPDPDEIDERVERERLIHARGAPVQSIPPGYVAGPPAPGGSALPPVPAAPAPESRPAQPPAGGGTVVPIRARTAAAPPPRPSADAARRTGQRLADLDNALFHSVHAAVETAMRHQLERAGGRIMARAARNRAVADAARPAPKHRVAAVLGKSVVASLGVTDEDLAPDYSELLDYVDRQTRRARDAGLAALLALARSTDRTVSDAALTEYRTRADAHAAAGRERLAGALVGLTFSRLYAPVDLGETDVPGEDYDSDVPPGLVRSALAVYGGQELGDTGKPVDGPVRGVAGGGDNLSIGAVLGIQTDIWQWAHGAPQHPFEAHEDLDGQVFGDDPESDAGRRANTSESWTGSTEFFPGDHDGCTCWAIPLLSMGDA